MDRYLSWLPTKQRLLIRGMFLLYELDFSIFNHGPSHRFSTASFEERKRCLDSWESSSLYFRRAAFQALKGTLLIGYLCHPTVQEQIGICPGDQALRHLASHRDAQGSGSLRPTAGHSSTFPGSPDSADTPSEQSRRPACESHPCE